MIRVVGDVHGKIDAYKRIISNFDGETFQVGDMGFSYNKLNELDPTKHRFIGGNHDNYDKITACKHYLGNYGIWNGAFFIRGGFSIDEAYRVEGISKWKDEEVNEYTGSMAYEAYLETLPSVVITHECPFSVVKHLTNPDFVTNFGFARGTVPTYTNMLLEMCLQAYTPELWIFGHYHRSFDEVIDGTRFICLAELEYKDFSYLWEEITC